MRFLDLLQESFERHARRPATELPDGQGYCYAEMAQRAAAVAGLLRSRGVEKGDRVALYLADKHAMLLAHIGALGSGAVPLPLNPKFTATELAYFLGDSGARAVVCDGQTRERASPVIQKLAASVPAAAMLAKGAAACSLISAEDVRGADPNRRLRPVECRDDDPALLLYSSGTTGEPKGVVHTQANLAHAVTALARFWHFSPEDVLVNVLPLFHIHGLSFATHVSWLSGSTMVVGESFHPRHTLDLIDRATVFMGVPPYYYSLLDRPEFPERARAWSRLRLATCGSAPIRPEVLPRLEEILGQPVINRYGMSEAHVITSLPVAAGGAHLPFRRDDGSRPFHGSVGVPLDGIEVRLVAPQTDEAAGRHEQEGKADAQSATLPAGATGEVRVRGRNLFRCYWNRPEATRATFDADGWFATGDVGELDEHGYLTLVGRTKDLIIVGGFNVYPEVVERVLAGCPGVREAAVFGLPDAKRGQRVAVAVVRDPASTWDERHLKRFCRERLVDYQCPAVVFLVDALPRNSMGKVLRRELQERFAAGPLTNP